jgi:potassium-transporting ATPase ATP-binding subunit
MARASRRDQLPVGNEPHRPDRWSIPHRRAPGELRPGCTLATSVRRSLTVVFSKLVKAFAKGRESAHADPLVFHGTVARLPDGTVKQVSELAPGDVVVVDGGEVIPCDGTVIDGAALVDESAITGESAPVLRESGGGRSAVVGGTRVLSSRILVEVVAPAGPD